MDRKTQSKQRLLSDVREQLLVDHNTSAEQILLNNPDLLAHKSMVVDLAFHEYRLRLDRGEEIGLSQFSNRFPNCRTSLLRRIAVAEFAEENAADLDFDETGQVNFPDLGDSFLGYELVEDLGSGALGKVYLADDRDLGRYVVVKVASRGLEEARRLSKLNHPNVVPIYLAEDDPDTQLFGIVMPFDSRTTLQDLLDAAYPEDRQLPPLKFKAVLSEFHKNYYSDELRQFRASESKLGEADYTTAILNIGEQLADALEHTHSRGILHLDLKPSNVLLTPTAVPMLLDFNLSSDSGNNSTMLGGTLPYMSPEQLHVAVFGMPSEVAPIDGRSDLFSLGVLLYELLGGKHPFGPITWQRHSKEVAEEMLARQKHGAEPLYQVNPRIDRQTSDIIQRCLSFDLQQRPRTAAELTKELKRCQSVVHRTKRFTRTKPKTTAAIATLVSVALMVLAAIWWASPSYVDRLLAAATTHMDRGEYGEALADYAIAVEQRPLDLDLRIARATAATRAELQQETLDFWSVAIETAKDHQPERVAEVENAAKVAIDELTQKHIREGWVAFDKFEYVEGVEAFTRALELQPRNPEPLFGRAMCRIELSESEEGLKDLESIYASRPNNEQGLAIRMAKINVLIRKFKFADAEKQLRSLQLYVPNNRVLNANLGYVLTLRREFDLAIPMLQQATVDFPTEATIWRNLAMALMTKHGQNNGRVPQKALEHIAKAIALGLKTPLAYENCAIISLYVDETPKVQRFNEYFYWMNIAVDAGYDTSLIGSWDHFPEIRNDKRFTELRSRKTNKSKENNRTSYYYLFNSGKWPH